MSNNNDDILSGSIKVIGGLNKSRTATPNLQVGTDADHVTLLGTASLRPALVITPLETIYLAKNGNDANTGFTSILPKLTLKSAISALITAGRNTIFIYRNGFVGQLLFQETVSINYTGTGNLRIVCENGETAEIKYNTNQDESLPVIAGVIGTIRTISNLQTTTQDFFIIATNGVGQGIFKSSDGITFTTIGLTPNNTYNGLSLMYQNKLYISAHDTNGATRNHLKQVIDTTITVVNTYTFNAILPPHALETAYSKLFYLQKINNTPPDEKPSLLFHSTTGNAGTWSSIDLSVSDPNTACVGLVEHNGTLYCIRSDKIQKISSTLTVTTHSTVQSGYDYNVVASPSASWYFTNPVSIGEFVYVQREKLSGLGEVVISRSTDLKSWEDIQIVGFTPKTAGAFLTDPIRLWKDRIHNVVWAISLGDTKIAYTVDGITWVTLDITAIHLNEMYQPTFFLGNLYRLNDTASLVKSNPNNIIVNSLTTGINDIQGIKLNGDNKALFQIYSTLGVKHISASYSHFEKANLDTIYFDRQNASNGATTSDIRRCIFNNVRNAILHTQRDITNTLSKLFVLDSLFYRMTGSVVTSPRFNLSSGFNAINQLTMHQIRNLFNINNIGSGIGEVHSCFIFSEMLGADILNIGVPIALEDSILNQPSIGVNELSNCFSGNPLFLNPDTNDFRLQSVYIKSTSGEYFEINSKAIKLCDGATLDSGCYDFAYTQSDTDGFNFLNAYNPKELQISHNLKRYVEQDLLSANIERSFVDTRMRITMAWDNDSYQPYSHFYQILKLVQEPSPISVYFNHPFGLYSGTCNYKASTKKLIDTTSNFEINRFVGWWTEIDFTGVGGTKKDFLIIEMNGEKISLSDQYNWSSGAPYNANQTGLPYRITFINMIVTKESLEAIQQMFSKFTKNNNKITYQGYDIVLETVMKKRI